MQTKHDWKKIIAEWSESGLSPMDYCRRFKVPASSFYQNRKQYILPARPPSGDASTLLAEKYDEAAIRKRNKSSLSNPVHLTQVMVPIGPEDSFSPTIKITTKSGSILEIFL